MKLSFSTNGWDLSWQEIYSAAVEYGYDGIEIHNILDEKFTGDEAPFGNNKIKKTIRNLFDNSLSVPCIDSGCMITDSAAFAANCEEIKKYIHVAEKIKAPYVRLRAGEEGDDETVYGLLQSLLPEAEKKGITLLIETAGIFADTARLGKLLNRFADDRISALWDVHNPASFFGEDPEDTIKNLGAHIKHVHLKDSVNTDGKTRYCLAGEGELDIEDLIKALTSLDYDGFISFECKPEDLGELGVADIVFPHFINYMSKYAEKETASVLYDNIARTGKYVYKKEELIDCTFGQLLDRMVKEFPDQYAFKYTTLDYTRTYREFRDDVDTFARSLISLGVKEGSHVAVWASNLPQWYIAFWAATKIGAVLVSVNTAYKIHEIEYLLRQSDTHTLVVGQGTKEINYGDIIHELAPELDNTKPGEPLHCERLPFLRNVITVGYRMPGALTWEEAIDRSVRVMLPEVYRRAAAVKSHDVANMQYTSGTTGFPKGVMLTHYNIINNGKCIGDRMDLSTADRMMIQVPMFHCFGMVLSMIASITHGVTIMPLPYFSPKPALACINQERITCFHGVPTMFISLLEHDDFAKTDFSYMRTGIMAGSPCPVSVMQDVVDKMNMKEITIVYGQTEASPGCTMSSVDDPLEVRIATVGRALPNTECKIIDPETGEDLPDNVPGEFVARGYNIMKGYYKMPKATMSAIDKDGWLHTGDLACRTPEGNYRITGRLKDMIIRGGENIYPKEIEEFIYTHPKVKDVQVIGVPDEQYGEEIMACIILKEGESMSEDEMKAYVCDHMARHKTPRYVDFVDSFPMNAAGKILKYQMRKDAVKKLGLTKADSIETA